MKKLKILPSVIYEFEAPDDVYKEAINFINSVDWVKEKNRDDDISYGITTRPNLQTNKNLKLLTAWSLKKVNAVRKNQKLDCEFLVAVNMWANCSFRLQWHHTHYHPLSYLSSIFYITGESGDTFFSRTSEYFNKVIKLKSLEDSQFIYKHKFKEKTLLVFPSEIMHSVSENNSFLPRTTISTNYLPSGRVGAQLSMGYNCDIVSKN